MNLYQINSRIITAFERAINEETGEILDEAKFEELTNLQIQREAKIENLLLWVKNLTAEAKAIKEEKQALESRQRAAERKAESIKKYIARELEGEKFETPRVKVTWRKSDAVEYTGDVYKLPEDCMKYLPPEIKKDALKKMLKSGVAIPGAAIVIKNHMQIK